MSKRKSLVKIKTKQPKQHYQNKFIRASNKKLKNKIVRK